MLPRASRRVFPTLFIFCLISITACEPPHPARAGISVVDDSGFCPDGCGLLVVNRDPNVIWSEIKFGGDYSSMEGLVNNFLSAARESVVATGRLNDGGAMLAVPGPEKYWMLTDGLVAAGGEWLLWSLPVPQIDDPAGGRLVTFHRSNAALVLDHPEQPLQ